MSDDLQPPRFGLAQALKCGRWLGAAACGAEATHHVLWSSDGDNGLVCGTHAAEARELWVYYALHRYRMECSMPGAVFYPGEDHCTVDESLIGFGPGSRPHE